MSRTRRAVAVVLVAATLPALGLTVPAADAAAGSIIRVNQVGYLQNEPKRAYLMTDKLRGGDAFDVVDVTGATVWSGTVGKDLGRWNSSYPHVFAIDFDPVTSPATYTIRVGGLSSPALKIVSGSAYRSLITNSLLFFQGQRDGADTTNFVLNRQPSHLHDRKASVYVPRYVHGRLIGMKQVGGPVDVAGGWFDAGDYLKFVGTTSFATWLMLTAVRDDPAFFGASGPKLTDEAERGIRWLLKMWDGGKKVLYTQVGIGNGGPGIRGDHDLWRTPESDDGSRGKANRFLAHRPVFRAGPPGAKLPPSLAGRFAAAMGLCYQVLHPTLESALADRCLRAGEQVFAQAKTSNVGIQQITQPNTYYREVEWRDDLELGAVELSVALRQATSLPSGLLHEDPAFYLKSAAKWANAYILGPTTGTDTFNLYDVSGLAHHELYRAMVAAGNPTNLAVSKGDLVADLRHQLDPALNRARNDPFGYGWRRRDPVPHAFGLAIQALAYQSITGDARYGDVWRHQVDWALGANAWGTSFVVGAGATFPECLHHQVANLVGALDGTSPLLLGATVAGPSSTVVGGGFFGNANDCPPGGGNAFKAFDQSNWHYVDRLRSWSTVEPSLDYTALSMLTFARLQGR